MGLDMFLTKGTYIGAHYNHHEAALKIEVTVAGKVITIDPSKVEDITERAGYWRKANAIHKWFVDNTQDGVDECQTTEVDKEKLSELLALCRTVLATAKVGPGQVHVSTSYKDGEKVKDYEPGDVILNPEEVAALLPSESGFFFGGTDYDERYLQDVRDTIEILEACDLDPKNYDVSYTYRASW